MNFEGCRCPWCGYVTMVLLEEGDTWVLGTCNECGERYKAERDIFEFGVVMTKLPSKRERIPSSVNPNYRMSD